jgi:hypothetical protein
VTGDGVATCTLHVMPGLVPSIHVLDGELREETWMAGTSPAMTMVYLAFRFPSIFERG